MINKFYKKCLISKSELESYNNVLNEYLNHISDEDDLVSILIENAIEHRENYYRDLYEDINRVIRGDILKDDIKSWFEIDTGNNDALTIMNNKASIFDVNNIKVELKPTYLDANDFANKETLVSVFNRILNESYLSKPQYKFAISDAIKYSRGFPMAITLIGWDDNATLGNGTNFMGDITCENIPIDDFYWDPSSTSIDTAEYCFIKKMLPFMKVDTFISQLKKGNKKLLEAFYVSSNANSVVDINNNTRVNNQVLVNNGAIELISLYRKERVDNKVIVKVYHIVGKQYVVGKQEYNIEYLPVAVLKENSAPNSFTGVSSVMLALPYLKQKALLDGIISTVNLMQKSPVYLYNTASGINGQELINWTGNQSGTALATNASLGDSARLLEVPSITSDMLAYRNSLLTDIQSAINSNDMNNFGSKLSGSAIQAMINQTTISENTSISELERYLVRFVSIVMAFLKTKLPLMKKEYLKFRAEAKTDDQDINNTGYELLDLTPDEFERLQGDIYINTELLRTSKKQKQQQDLLNLFQMQLQYTGKVDTITLKDIVAELDLPNKQAVIERLENSNKENQVNNAINFANILVSIIQNPELQNLNINDATMLALEQMSKGVN